MPDLAVEGCEGKWKKLLRMILGCLGVTRIAYLIRRESPAEGSLARLSGANNIVPNERTFIFEMEARR